MSTSKTKQTPQLKINAKELKNILEQYEPNLDDTDETYTIKKALNKLDRADKIIYCIYLEVGTKTQTANILGISRISCAKIIKEIESKIKSIVFKQ